MIFDRATVCDATLPFVAGWEGQDEILDRYHRLGIAFLSLTIANDMAGPGAVVRHIADLRARIEASPQKFLLVRTVEDIRDDQIKACAKTGGIICLTGVGSFLSPAGTALPELFVPHARHIAELVGPRHLGIGIDNVYFQRQLEELKAANPHVWPAGTAVPSKYFEPEQLPALADTLLGAGFDDEVIGILGENYLRVAGEVWRPSGEQR
jgi:hypothetical protein